MHDESTLTLPEPNPAVTETVEKALAKVRESLRIARTVDYSVVIDTGRQFSDGTPVMVRAWMPTSAKDTLVFGDGGITYVRLGELAETAPDYALSVRREMLEHLPVREIKGQIYVVSKLDQAAEAMTLLADCCLMLDVSVIVANHLRPKMPPNGQ